MRLPVGSRGNAAGGHTRPGGMALSRGIVLPLEASLVASERLGLFHNGVMVLFDNLHTPVMELDT